MLILRTLLATAALTVIPTAAFADTFSVFQVQGSFPSLASTPNTLSGTMTLDTTTGQFTAENLTFYAYGSITATYSSLFTQGFLADGVYFLSFPGVAVPGVTMISTSTELILELPTMPSAGQTLSFCDISTPCVKPSQNQYESEISFYYSGLSSNLDQIIGMTSGQISPLAVSTATPEPSSFVLLGTGLIAVGAAFRRRLRGR